MRFWWGDIDSCLVGSMVHARVVGTHSVHLFLSLWINRDYTKKAQHRTNDFNFIDVSSVKSRPSNPLRPFLLVIHVVWIGYCQASCYVMSEKCISWSCHCCRDRLLLIIMLWYEWEKHLWRITSHHTKRCSTILCNNKWCHANGRIWECFSCLIVLHVCILCSLTGYILLHKQLVFVLSISSSFTAGLWLSILHVKTSNVSTQYTT